MRSVVAEPTMAGSTHTWSCTSPCSACGVKNEEPHQASTSGSVPGTLARAAGDAAPRITLADLCVPLAELLAGGQLLAPAHVHQCLRGGGQRRKHPWRVGCAAGGSVPGPNRAACPKLAQRDMPAGSSRRFRPTAALTAAARRPWAPPSLSAPPAVITAAAQRHVVCGRCVHATIAPDAAHAATCLHGHLQPWAVELEQASQRFTCAAPQTDKSRRRLARAATCSWPHAEVHGTHTHHLHG